MANQLMVDEAERQSFEDHDASYHMPHPAYDRLVAAIQPGEYGHDLIVVSTCRGWPLESTKHFELHADLSHALRPGLAVHTYGNDRVIAISRLAPGVFEFTIDPFNKEVSLIWRLQINPAAPNAAATVENSATTYKLNLDKIATVDDIRAFIATISTCVNIIHGAGADAFAQAHYDASRDILLRVIATA